MPVFFVNFFVTLLVIIIVSLLTRPPEDVVKLHEEIFRKVPVEAGGKTLAEARAKSQVENVAEFVLGRGDWPEFLLFSAISPPVAPNSNEQPMV